MPLEFLRRKSPATGPAATPAAPAAPSRSRAAPLPEEAVAQDHQLRLTFSGKTSEGVRMKGGAEAMDSLPGMVVPLARSPVEVVEALDPGLGHASPTITHADEANLWLRARAGASPITRHGLFILESLDALDPAFDTFACALLDGDLDLGGYPEYASIVGGVAAHWDESTGDLIVRGVIGWGGRGTRGDTDRTGNRILAALLGNILETSGSLGVTALDRPVSGGSFSGVTCAHCGFEATGRAMFCPKCGMRLLRG
ncbi:MAG TPA: zinc ribbon domain-containing protein [Candidatus Limnocylindrales bacterium]|nr:zinc ribbon domain-containing protein [Candidatus Limnocylindrales bacterium]